MGFVGNDVNVKIKVYTNLSGWGQTSVEKGTLAAEKAQTFKHTDINYTFTVTKETVLTAIYEKSPSGGDSENNSGENSGNGSDGTTSSDYTGLSCAADAGVAANGILIIGLCVTAIIRFALKKLKNRIARL